MNSCILHSEPSILRWLHYAVTLLIAKIFPNYGFELEFLILVYCLTVAFLIRCLGTFSFINSYSNMNFACYLFVFYLFYNYCYQIIIYTFSTYVLLGAKSASLTRVEIKLLKSLAYSEHSIPRLLTIL